MTEKENIIKIEKGDNPRHFNGGCLKLTELLFSWNRRNDDCIWSILGSFYRKENGTGTSRLVRELKIPARSVERAIGRLKKNGLIYLYFKNCGVNKSEKIYQISEDGAVLFEQWVSYESKRNLQRKLKI